MRPRPLIWLRALAAWKLDDHVGRLALIVSQGLLWLGIMSGIWIFPNEISVWLRLGVTVFSLTIAGLIVRGANVAEQEARREHRLKNHLCIGCGYDLRPAPGECPECGLEPPGARATRYAEKRMRRRLTGVAPAHKKAGVG
jgi:hypothetical protein